MSGPRVPAGVPSGGQFTTSRRAEADVALLDPTDPTEDDYQAALGYLRARLDEDIAPPAAAPPLHEATAADLPALAHCSADGFDPDRCEPVRNDSFEKPTGGVWLSPVAEDGRTAWAEFLHRQRYRLDTLARVNPVGLDPDAKVLVINGMDDLRAAHAAYPPPDPRGLNERGLDGNRGLDFERIAADGYAALWLTRRGQATTHRPPEGEPNLYAWDVESVLVLDPDAIVAH